jgi:glycosyltransferase involved in cell wall biosynthesis
LGRYQVSQSSSRARCAFVIPGDIALPTGGYVYDRRVLALFDQHGVDASHVALSGAYPDPAREDFHATALAIAKTPKDAVLLFDGLAYAVIPPALIRGFDRTIVALVHHPLCLEAGLDPERADELRALEIAALAEAQHVIVTSHHTGRSLIEDFAVPAAKVTVAEPGTDRSARAIGSGHAHVQLLAVGSIIPRKGYDVLIEALAALPDRNWHLTIAGAERDAVTAATVRAAVSDAGLQTKVTFKGAVDEAELAALYAAADIFVMPSLFEGYGMVLTEAMARGLPIVCTTGGAAAETCPDGAALKVAPGDAVAFRGALTTLLADPALRAKLSDASWTAAATLPTWDETTRRIAAVLKRGAE